MLAQRVSVGTPAGSMSLLPQARTSVQNQRSRHAAAWDLHSRSHSLDGSPRLHRVLPSHCGLSKAFCPDGLDLWRWTRRQRALQKQPSAVFDKTSGAEAATYPKGRTSRQVGFTDEARREATVCLCREFPSDASYFVKKTMFSIPAERTASATRATLP